jgi:uncharacterized Tic20 family protein
MATRKTKNDDRTFATLAHVLGLFTWVVAPLLIWLFMKDSSSFVEKHAKEALNFQISLTIYWMAAAFLSIFLIGIFLMPLLFIFEIIVIIQAAKAANDGKNYSYPLTLRLVA